MNASAESQLSQPSWWVLSQLLCASDTGLAVSRHGKALSCRMCDQLDLLLSRSRLVLDPQVLIICLEGFDERSHVRNLLWGLQKINHCIALSLMS